MAKKTQKHKKEKSHNSYVGLLDITRSGMGYVVVEGLQKDILVRPSDFNRAFHGDKVKINSGTLKGIEGYVLESRGTAEIDVLLESIGQCIRVKLPKELLLSLT